MFEKYGAIKASNNLYNFTVFAPNAKSVFLLLNDQIHEMAKEDGDWKISTLASHGNTYSFIINEVEKFDPFGRYFEKGLVAKIFESTYQMKYPKIQKPITNESKILQIFLDLQEGQNYKDKAHEIIEFLKTDSSYTHVLFLPFFHYENKMTLGYKADGYFAPQSRFGNPDDLKYMIDLLHQNNYPVFVDIVLWEFSEYEPNGMFMYDGSFLYDDGSVHNYFTGHMFDIEKKFVQDFLKSFLVFWETEYKIDGFRIDGMNEFLNIHPKNLLGESKFKHAINEILSVVQGTILYEGITDFNLEEIGMIGDFMIDDMYRFDAWNLITAYRREEPRNLFNKRFEKLNNKIMPISHDFFINGITFLTQYQDWDKMTTEKILFVFKLIYAKQGPKIIFKHYNTCQFSIEEEWEKFMKVIDSIKHLPFKHYRIDRKYFFEYGKNKITMNEENLEVKIDLE